MFKKGFTELCRKAGGLPYHIRQPHYGRHSSTGRALLCEGSGWGFDSPWRPKEKYKYMSYKNKKLKRSVINQLRFFVKKTWAKFFYNTIKKRKEKRKMVAVKKVMDFLRNRNRLIRTNNLRINEWVDDYVRNCFLEGKTVNVLTQWCLSKALEKRFKEQGRKFVPTKKERRVLEAEIPLIISVFLKNGFRVNWWITFNRSYLDSRLVDEKTENQYKKIIIDLARSPVVRQNVLFLDWEDDIIRGRPKADRSVLENFDKYVSKNAFEIELQRWRNWAQEEAGLQQIEKELRKDVIYQIACEAYEGQFLSGPNSPFSPDEFILIPLEVPERFDSFTLLAKDFKKRIVAVLSPYPWRMKLKE